MKHCLFTMFFVWCMWNVRAQHPREILNFNSGWKFFPGEIANGQSINLNDQDWHKIDLPHDWSIEGSRGKDLASCTGYLPGGIGWYRKTFELSATQKSKNIYVYFDGVYKNSQVWINGQFLGNRPNGFIPFYYDLTKFINKKGKNIIAVRVDHSDFADSRWYTGSGINRDVRLIAVNPVHIPVWGVTFTTPEVSKDLAKTSVNVAVKNTTATAADVTVKCDITDKNGKTVSFQKSLNALPGKDQDVTLDLDIQNPFLWSVETPDLYKLEVSLLIDGKKTDEVNENVGIRNIRFDPNEGFFLNGKNTKLKGVCIHDDAGALGTAVPAAVWESRLLALKKTGCNAIRMSHNPHASFLYDLCDKLGFLVMDEAFDEWEEGKKKWIEGWNVGKPGKDGYHTYFREWSDIDLRDMILRNRNHPSIIMWSIGNEIDYPNDPYTHEILNTGRNPQIYGKGIQPDHPSAVRLGELSKHLVAIAKQNDTTRPVTAALAGVIMSNMVGYPQALDIVGYNYQEFRYPEDHEKYPNRVIYGSENGMGLNAWMAVDTNAYVSAQFLWTGVDYLGEAGKWPSRGSKAGLLDLAGFPKPEYYFRKSLWSDEPVVFIATSTGNGQNARRSEANWNYGPGEIIRVNCFTNCDEAELFLNQRSLGKKLLSQFKDRVITWDATYEPGVLLVRAYNNGKEVAQDSLKTSGKPASLKLKPELTEEGGLVQVEIDVVDSTGTLVCNAENEITVSVKGPGKLLGLENGDLTSLEDMKADQRKVFHGKLRAYVQPVKKGKIKIVVTSPGLKPETLVIK